MSAISPSGSEIIESHYHTPSAAALAAFPVVMRAGHLRAASDYRVERRRSPGHDLLFCLKGAGNIRVHNRTFHVVKGELAWIYGYQPHAHWAAPDNPWELLWLRMDGAGLESLSAILSVNDQPVFTGLPRKAVTRCFRQTLRLMAKGAVHMEAHIHVIIAELMKILWDSRQQLRPVDQRCVPAEIALVLNRMNLYPHLPWTATELAKLSGVSVPQFYRRFRDVTGAAPIDWLRRERISLAKRRLRETNDSIKTIADQVGFNCPFFFSRVFKKYTGQSPSEFRR